MKLGDMEAITIRERYKNGEKVKDLAAEYGVCITTINNVIIHKSWPGIKF